MWMFVLFVFSFCLCFIMSSRLQILKVFVDAACRRECECYDCRHCLQSSFALSYYEYHGLQYLPVGAQVSRDRMRIEVSKSLISDCFAIVERRMSVVRCEVASLTSLSAFMIWKNAFQDLDLLPLPDIMKEKLSSFELCFSVAERFVSQAAGCSVLKVWSLPVFLYRHEGCFIEIRR